MIVLTIIERGGVGDGEKGFGGRGVGKGFKERGGDGVGKEI